MNSQLKLLNLANNNLRHLKYLNRSQKSSQLLSLCLKCRRWKRRDLKRCKQKRIRMKHQDQWNRPSL